MIYLAKVRGRKPSVVVQSAFSRKYNKDVALKTITSPNCNNLNRLEGKVLQELTKRKCKHIVKLYGMYEAQISDTEFCYSLVLERATMSLKNDIKKWSKNPAAEREHIERETEALKVIDHISFAMDKLSKCSIWHKDIKPAHILIFEKQKNDYNGARMIRKYKLTDFNISREYLNPYYGGTEAERCYNMPVRFAAPEINKSAKYMDMFGSFLVDFSLCDIYSLGLSVLRMLTKKRKNEWNNNLVNLQARMDKTINENCY